MTKTALFQCVRVTAMVLAVAGIIYALVYLPDGGATRFWIALLGIGFAGLLYSFRVAQRTAKNSATERGGTLRNDRRSKHANTGRMS